ncbi:MAG: UDP-N-acetylmuramate--L-alanine ligase [Ignavibacteria bacterium]|jgi:UDP-N-acetylmuramate--alanine ligase
MIPITAIDNTKNIYFIGIGGIGMSGLAEYYLRNGYNVSGSDITDSNITNRLKNLGAKIFIGHSKNNISTFIDTVVYTSAVHEDNPEMIRARELNIKTIKRAEILGEIVNDKYLIAVSGTHGKTTTTAMIAKVLIDSGLDPLVFVGGNVPLFEGAASRMGQSNYAVVEADEYDRSFLALKPNIAVITNIDVDHLDIYKDLDDIKNAFKTFCGKTKPGSRIIYCGDDRNVKSTVQSLTGEKMSYGFDNTNFLKITDYNFRSDKISFSLINSYRSYKNIQLGLIGRHNVLNSTACFAVSKILNIEFDEFRKSMKGFHTVDRRLQLKYKENNIQVYDDYSHHPREIEMSLRALKEASKNMRLISVFQPHLYSRTRDFYREFALQLAAADKVFLLDIYPAREEPIENITSKLIYDELKKMNVQAEYISDKDELRKKLLKSVQANDIIVFQGAGDVTIFCDEFIRNLSNQ